MANAYSYNPLNVTVFVGGEVISDFEKGSLVTVRMTEKQFTYTAGLVDGVRTYNPNKHGSITLRLIQGSPSNIILNEFLKADINPSTTGFFPLIIADRNAQGGNIAWFCRAATCWVTEFPDWDITDKVSARQWVLESNAIEYGPTTRYSRFTDQTGEPHPPQLP